MDELALTLSSFLDIQASLERAEADIAALGIDLPSELHARLREAIEILSVETADYRRPKRVG
jgi:hypothetical protein